MAMFHLGERLTFRAWWHLQLLHAQQWRLQRRRPPGREVAAEPRTAPRSSRRPALRVVAPPGRAPAP